MRYDEKTDKTESEKGRWIGCDGSGCSVWVHGSCVGWTEEVIDSKKEYTCSVCVAAKFL